MESERDEKCQASEWIRHIHGRKLHLYKIPYANKQQRVSKAETHITCLDTSPSPFIAQLTKLLCHATIIIITIDSTTDGNWLSNWHNWLWFPDFFDVTTPTIKFRCFQKDTEVQYTTSPILRSSTENVHIKSHPMSIQKNSTSMKLIIMLEMFFQTSVTLIHWTAQRLLSQKTIGELDEVQGEWRDDWRVA